jgi:hypothetical protein
MNQPSPCWWTNVIRHGSVTHWSPSGRLGSNPEATGFGRVAAAMTLSGPSSRRHVARAPYACGFWTQTWRRRSTGSIITTCFP